MDRFRPFDWYEQALYYDVIFDADTEEEADFLEGVLERHGRARRRGWLLEPACGTGRLLRALARRGHPVAGFDLTPGSLRFARERLDRERLDVPLWRGDMARFAVRPGSCALIHCLVSTFKYLLDEEGAVAHLRSAEEALAPGGVYVLGLHLSDYGRRRSEVERWEGRRGELSVACETRTGPPDRDTRSEALRTRLTAKRRGRTERFETRWTFRTYDPEELQALLAAAPELEHVGTYAFDYDLTAPTGLADGNDDKVLVLRKA